MKKQKNIPKQTLQAVGYCRVSTLAQADQGVSIAAQKAKIKQWVKLNDATLIDIYEDNGVSGKTIRRRAGFQKCMEAVLQHKAVLVCYSLSRLSRSMKDMLSIGVKLNQAGCGLASTTEDINTTTATGKMVFHLLTVLNQFYVDQISEYTKLGLAHVRSLGLKCGGNVPYGWDAIDRKLHRNPTEWKVIKKILKLHNGGVSYGSICTQLNNENIPTKLGNKWFTQSVKNVILANNKTSKP